MRFRLVAAVRALLWISLLTLGQFPSPGEAQTAAQNREEIRNLNQKLSAVEKALAELKTALSADKGQQFDQRLSVLEKAGAAAQAVPNITDEHRAYLNRVDSLKEKFNGIKDDMALTAERLSGSAMNISYNYFTIFGLIFSLLVALGGTLGALGAVYMKKMVLESVTEDAKKQIATSFQGFEKQFATSVEEVKKQLANSIAEEKNEMQRIARFETDLAMANTLFKMSFAWWAQYEEPFRKLLPKRKTRTDHETFNALPEAALLQLTMARILSERGMKIADAFSSSDIKEDDNRPWVIRARLLNLWVYNTTADFCRKKIASDGEKKELLKSADSLMDLAKDKRAAKNGFWYNFQQTAAFAMMNAGDPAAQQFGQALVNNLCAKKAPGDEFELPPQEWIVELQAENRLGVTEENSIDVVGNETPENPAPT